MTTPGDMNSEEFRLARNARIDAISATAEGRAPRRRYRDGVNGCACCGLDRKYGLKEGLCQICQMRGHQRPPSPFATTSDEPASRPADAKGQETT